MPTPAPLCSCYVPNDTGLELNAIPPLPDPSSDDRKTLRLSQCARLIDIGMELAELAADRAREELQTKPPADAPPTPPPAHGQDAATLFTRLARCVRTLMALETRLIQGPTARARAEPPAPKEFDHGIKDPVAFVRTCVLNEALFKSSQSDPNRWNISQKTAKLVDELVAALPHLTLAEIFEQACQILGFTPDLSRLTPYLTEEIFPDRPP